jgi:hypothetical protein
MVRGVQVMRVISGFVAAAMLAVLSQPAWAVCINRGGAIFCYENPKYWEPSVGPEKEATGDERAGSVKMIVLEPDGSTSGNAWVMMPQSGDGAIAQVSTNGGVPACELGRSC